MSKIRTVRNATVSFFQMSKAFGLEIALRQFICTLFKCGRASKHKAILKYLEKHYKVLIDRYIQISDKSNNYPTAVLSADCPIWVCWFQGEKSMPPIVKGCYATIKRHAGLHPVKLITIENYSEYVSIPQYIIDKHERKELSYTAFSDILRNNLLADHGGIWLDASIYLTDELKDWERPFCTIKQDRPDDNLYVSGYRWTSFCLGGVKGNLLNSFVKDFFNVYFQKEKIMIDYFLIDYAIALGYENVPAIKKLVDDVPYTSPDLYFMQINLTSEVTDEEFNRVIRNTSIFKLNRRVKDPTDKHSLYYRLGFGENI